MCGEAIALDQVRDDGSWGQGGTGEKWINSRAIQEMKSAVLSNRLDIGNRETRELSRLTYKLLTDN